MGEYAIDRATGEEVKIGTCESMYYLRADMVDQVRALPGNVDPVADRFKLRFRFPLPGEDGFTVAQLMGVPDYQKGHGVGGYTVPKNEHYTVQFKAEGGYLLSLPCPEGDAVPEGLHIGRNGYTGGAKIVAQRWQDDDTLTTVVMCGGCKAMWRLCDWAEALPLVEAVLREAGERHFDMWQDTEGGRVYCGGWNGLEIARRVMMGYPEGAAIVDGGGFSAMCEGVMA
jgi:hypothetical protein